MSYRISVLEKEIKDLKRSKEASFYSDNNRSGSNTGGTTSQLTNKSDLNSTQITVGSKFEIARTSMSK